MCMLLSSASKWDSLHLVSSKNQFVLLFTCVNCIKLLVCIGALSVRSRFFSNLIPSRDHTLSLHCDDSANSLQMCTHELQEQCMQDEAGVVCQGRTTVPSPTLRMMLILCSSRHTNG